MPVRFPYLPVTSDRGDPLLMPLMPLGLRFKDDELAGRGKCGRRSGVIAALPDRGSVSRSALREVDELNYSQASVAGRVAAGHRPALRTHGGAR